MHDRVLLAGPLVKRRTDERRLSGPGFPNENRQTGPRRESVTQMRERFASEMKRAGNENGMRSGTRLIERVRDRWSNGVGE